ncbi:MAG TPA: hypothetical protein VGM94_01200 [Galbitalea sp.]
MFQTNEDDSQIVQMSPTISATQVFAFLGKRGSGKTYCCGRFVEQLLGHKIQVVIVDVVGTWWGLRLGTEGDGANGFSIPVIGGQHGDILLSHEAGALIASTLVDTGSSAVLDLSDMRKGQRQRFLTDWAEEFFHEKKSSRSPVHIVLEEAHTIVPQRVMKGQERMLGAMEDLVRLGRNYGIGVSMLDQRPQSVNKDVLNQAEVIAAFQLPGSQERKAIKEWAEAKELPEVNTALKQLASLPRGQCILWSPEWLKICQRVNVLPKTTFDASATPDAKEHSDQPVKMRPVNLDELKRAMEELEIGEKAVPSFARITKVTDGKVIVAGWGQSKGDPLHHAFVQDGKNREAELEAAVTLLTTKLNKSTEALSRLTDDNARLKYALASIREIAVPLGDIHDVLTQWIGPSHPPETLREPPPCRVERKKNKPATIPGPSKNVPGYALANPTSKVERAMLSVLAARPSGLTRRQVRIYSGYAEGGSVTSALATLVREQWAVPNNDLLVITPRGLQALGPYTLMPVGVALREHFERKLDKVERKMFRVICDRYPGAIAREMARDLAGYKPGGSVTSGMAHLASLDIITITAPGYVRAADELFEEGERRP